MERLGMSSPTRAIVGEPAPRFNCKCIIDGRIKDISLSSLLQTSQWTILIFFPMAWSFICPGEILAFSARRHEFTTRGCTVLFASCDSEHVLKVWNATEAEEGGLGNASIPLLSDRSHRLSRDYGVLIEEEGIAQRAMFFIDPTGIIRCANVNDANVGRSVDDTRRLLDALKFTDEFGEGCPVDWKSGQKGVQMDWSDGEAPDSKDTLAFNKGTQNPYPGSSIRPMLNRGSSWSSGWGKAANMRPKTWGSNGSQGVPQTVVPAAAAAGNGSAPVTPPTPGSVGRPRSLLWGGNEDAMSIHEGLAV